MKTYLRILSYALRYPRTVVLAIVLSVFVAMLYTSQIASLIPVFNVLFDEQGLAKALHDPRVQPYLMGSAHLLGAEEALAGLEGSIEVRKRLFLWAVIGLIGLLIVQHIFRFWQEYVVGQVVQRSIEEINKELFRKVIRQPVQFFRKQGSGDIVSRFTNDAFMVATGTKIILEKLIREPLKIVMVLSLALYLDARLTFLTIACIPVAGGLAWSIGRKVKKGTRRMLKGRSRMIVLVRDLVAGIRIVKVSGAEEREIRRFDDEADNIYRQNMAVVLADAAATPVMVSLTSIFAALAVTTAGQKVFDGTLTPGEFVAFYGAIFGVLDPVRRLSSIWNRIQGAVAGGERVFEFIDRVPEVRDQPVAAVAPRISDSIELRDVEFHYLPGEPVLKGVNLVVHRGERLAIVGHSGEGKSTLVNLIPRFHDPISGAVYLDGLDLRSIRLHSLRSQISIVTQEPILFSDSIAANIRYSRPDATHEEVIEAARAANAHKFIEEFEQGYGTRVGDDGANLSGGQRQRIAIARAILANPAILILDEASSSLDSVSESAIKEALDRFMVGRTTIVIAHRLSTIESSDRIAVLKGGRIEAVAPHRELLSQSPTYRELHAAQFSGSLQD